MLKGACSSTSFKAACDTLSVSPAPYLKTSLRFWSKFPTRSLNARHRVSFGRPLSYGYKKGVDGIRYDRSLDVLPSDLYKDRTDASPVIPSKRNAMSHFHAVDMIRLPVFDSSVPADHLYQKVVLHSGDITRLRGDAIVTSSLTPNLSQLNSGIMRTGALQKTAGPEFIEKCSTLSCQPGQALLVKGFGLPSDNVIITASPAEDDDYDTLAKCYISCLNVAKSAGLRTIAFPCIATGYTGIKQYEAARIACQTVSDWLADKANFAAISRIVFVTHLDEDWKIYYTQVPSYMNRRAGSGPTYFYQRITGTVHKSEKAEEAKASYFAKQAELEAKRKQEEEEAKKKQKA